VTNSKEIRVAIIGVGNCANSLIQGVTYYKDAAADVEIPGLMHAVLGGYHVRDVNFVAAFDVDAKKVGLDLADAIWASENNTIKFASRSTVTGVAGSTSIAPQIFSTTSCGKITVSNPPLRELPRKISAKRLEITALKP